MAAINQKRVWIGTVAAGVAWSVWSMIVNAGILARHYTEAGAAGFLLKQPRYPYPLFLIVWFLSIFVMSYVIAWLYASVRATQGPGPKTALLVGLGVGFAAGFPINFSVTTWIPFTRVIPLWWTLDMWVGAVIAAMVAGWLYKD